jgi:hypothetical protein
MNTAAIIEDWVSAHVSNAKTSQQAAVVRRQEHTGDLRASLARNTPRGRHGRAPRRSVVPRQHADSATELAARKCSAADRGTLPGNHLLACRVDDPLPLLGNAPGFAIDATTGIYGEFALPSSPPVWGNSLPSVLLRPAGGCHQAIDPTPMLAFRLLPTQIVSTHVPMSLAGLPPALAGTQLHTQALVIDLLPYTYLPYQGITNALRVTLGQ